SALRSSYDCPGGDDRAQVARAMRSAPCAEQATPHESVRCAESQQREPSVKPHDATTSMPARWAMTSASCSVTPNASLTRYVTSGKDLAASPTRRGMSRVVCLPGESMYGKAKTSVAPARTQSPNPSAIDGSASSM